jgi:glycosyltransferase involved in cell wall biosynthesis
MTRRSEPDDPGERSGSDSRIEESPRPTVSVVVTTYDRPTYLPEAVATVAEQTYDPVELIVVDDASPTPASEVVSADEYEFSAFEIVRHDENRGPNAARNTGVEAASGEYIAFLDDDDRWHPEKLERQVARFEAADGDLGVVSTGWKRVRDGTTEEVWLPPEIDGDVTRALLCRNVVGTQSAVMVRASVAKRVPLDERFPRWADQEWYVSLSTECGFDRIREPLVVHEFETHNRITDDTAKLYEAHRLFVEKYLPLAADYGPVMERKMRGWADFRVGKPLLRMGEYRMARRFLTSAVRWYPLEPRFYAYAGSSLGGRWTHSAARSLNELTPLG